MKILITGAKGQLGYDLCRTLNNHELIPLTHAELDITSMASVKDALHKYDPDILINTAAYVRVDDCEDHQDEAYLVNAIGTRNVAVACEDKGVKLMHISTDYVFGGEGRTQNIPYTEFDTPVPLSVYGKSKLAGEDMVKYLSRRYFIVRASGLFGVAGSSGKGGNFIETILRLAKTRPELKVVNDQVFSPTYTHDLARKIFEIINTEYYGIFHITNRGCCSWYEFTREILLLAGIKTPVYPITSVEYPQKAKRPAYSVLDHFHLRLLGIDDMRPWENALMDYMMEKGHLNIPERQEKKKRVGQSKTSETLISPQINMI